MLLGIAVRVGLLAWGEYQDSYMEVKYTDIDYQVYTDASSYVWQGESPYQRHTYRYTPLLAYLLVPNLYFAPFGKVLFVLGDLVAACLIYNLLQKAMVDTRWVWVWWLNPLVFNISTRGSSDSICSVLVLATIYFLKTKKYSTAAFFYGLSVHFRIYPIIYALSFYLETGNKNKFFCPDKVKFAFISGGVFLALAGVFYWVYGYEFLYETYLYHFTRKDNRHNFSLYFYMLYLTFESSAKLLGLAAFIPQWGLITYLSFVKGQIYLKLLCQTIVFVIFNKVCTAQYFTWYITLLPLVLPKANISLKKGLFLVATWVGTELHWLFWGYKLEFLGENVFIHLWFASVLFFFANVWILCEFLKSMLKTKDKLE